MFDPNKFDLAFRNAIKFEQIMSKLEHNVDQISFLTTKFSKGFKYSRDQADLLLKRTQQLNKEMTTLALKQAGITREQYLRERGLIKELKITKEKRLEIEKIQKALAQKIKTTQANELATNLVRSMSLSRRILMKEGLNFNNLKETERLRAGFNGNFNTPLGKTILARDAQYEKQKKEISVLQKEMNLTDKERVKIMAGQSDQVKALNKEMKELNKAYAEQEKLETLILVLKQEELAQKKREQQYKFKDFLANKFGGVFEELGPFLEMGALLGTLALAIAGILLLIKSLFGTFRDALKSTIDLGFDASQRMGLIANANRQTAEELKQHALITPEENIQAQNALAARLGTLLIPDEAVTRVALLNRQIGLSVDNASSLLEYFVRIGGESTSTAAKQLVAIKAFAMQNHLNTRMIMEDVNNNLENFAKSNHETAESMARAAIGARQLGINLDTISGFANKMTSNFDDFLASQASIGTFLPGFSLNAAFMASQFGNLDDVTKQLKATLGRFGADTLTNLPTSLKQQMAGALGISFDQIMKIVTGTDNVKSPNQQTVQEALANGLNEAQKAIVSPLDSINRGVYSIFSLLTDVFHTGDVVARQNQRMADYFNRGAGSVKPSDIDIGPTSEILKNSLVTTMFHQGVSSTQLAAATDRSARIEQKMDTLTNTIKNGINIYLDGKKVSQGLYNPYGK